MIIPIGHDKGLRRLPIVTLAIIVVCTLLQLHRSLFAPSFEELSRAEEDRLVVVAALVRDLRVRDLTIDPMPIVRGDYRGIDHPLVSELERLDRELAAFAQQDLALRFAWSPDIGVTPNLIRYAFVHAGWIHLVGNMLFLLLAGAAIEDRWGHLAFLLFYLAAAVAAAAAFALWHPGSSVPAVGASGAVAGCMGAFLIAYGRVTIRFAYLWVFTTRVRVGTFEARAIYALPVWFAQEAFYSYFELDGAGGVAHSAHVGGFVFGVLAAAALKYSGFETRYLMLLDERADEWTVKNPELDEGLSFERSGQKSAALASFRQVLAREPNHAIARAHALDCALELRKTELVRSLAEVCFRDLLREGRRDDVAVLYTKTRDAGLAGELGDRMLAEIARLCLAHETHAPVGVQVVRQMLDAPEPSTFLPGLLWQVAEVQAAAGRVDLATRTLGMLVARFPVDPFADHARARLAGAAGTVTSAPS